MIKRDRYLIGFSIVSSFLSAALGFLERFIESLDEVDKLVIFFSGVFMLLVILILLFFLFKDVISKSLDTILIIKKLRNKGIRKKKKRKKR